jgi:hypothetical protein
MVELLTAAELLLVAELLTAAELLLVAEFLTVAESPWVETLAVAGRP